MALRNAETRAGENDEATAVRRNNALRTTAIHAANLPFHNFGRRDIMPELHELGAMTSVCLQYYHEGKVSLPNLEPYPQELYDFMLEDTA